MTLKKKIRLSGDKSISHRALMLACVSSGNSRLSNLCGGADVQSTINCLRACGAIIDKKDKHYTIYSSSLKNPNSHLNCGNSGTTMRLITGLLSGQKINAVLYGDDSLSKRPMDRIVEPLKKMGANLDYINNQLVLKKSTINGGQIYNPTSSAQVKSSIILAALGGKAKTVLTESYNTRDHTEKMVSYYSHNSIESSGKKIVINPSKMEMKNMEIPGDISKASFLIAYACLSTHSNLLFENILINPRRMGFIKTLNKMGANISIENKKNKYGEFIGNIHVKSNNRLNNIHVNDKDVRDMIDEIPILSVVAAYSKGIMTITGLSELKLKESNRIIAIVSNLNSMGCDIREGRDSILIKGQKRLYNTSLNTFSDHRIAMSFYIASLFAKHTPILNESECIKVSFPDFFDKLGKIKI